MFRILQEYLSVGHTKLNQMFSGVSKSPTIGVRGAMGRVNLRVWREIFVHRSWSLITQIACRRNPKAHFLLQSAKHNISNCIPNLREELQGSVYELSTDRERAGSYGDNAIVGAHQGDGAGAPCGGWLLQGDIQGHGCDARCGLPPRQL